MKYPSLVSKRFCATPVSVVIYGEGLSEDGAPMVVYEGDLVCNYRSKVKTVLTAQKKEVQLSGVLMFSEDFAPDVPTLSGGYVELFGEKRTIAQGIKARNPDGTVNYVELDVV